MCIPIILVSVESPYPYGAEYSSTIPDEGPRPVTCVTIKSEQQNTADTRLNMEKLDTCLCEYGKTGYLPMRIWKKQIFAYAKAKMQISCAVSAQLISIFVFATWML